MVRGEETVGGHGQPTDSGQGDETLAKWAPPKRPVTAEGPTHRAPASRQARAKVLAELGTIVERLEQAVASRPPIEPGRKEATPREADLSLALREFTQQQEDALERLNAVAERLALAVGRLEAWLSELPSPLEQGYALHPGEPVRRGAAAAFEERRFLPGEGAVSIILAPVLDFQGLMELYRALSGLPAAEGASVVRFKNGEASFEVLLRAGVSASQIAQTLRESTGERLLIEESRPEAHRLRLRLEHQRTHRLNHDRGRYRPTLAR